MMQVSSGCGERESNAKDSNNFAGKEQVEWQRAFDENATWQDVKRGSKGVHAIQNEKGRTASAASSLNLRLAKKAVAVSKEPVQDCRPDIEFDTQEMADEHHRQEEAKAQKRNREKERHSRVREGHCNYPGCKDVHCDDNMVVCGVQFNGQHDIPGPPCHVQFHTGCCSEYKEYLLDEGHLEPHQQACYHCFNKISEYLDDEVATAISDSGIEDGGEEGTGVMNMEMPAKGPKRPLSRSDRLSRSKCQGGRPSSWIQQQPKEVGGSSPVRCEKGRKNGKPNSPMSAQQRRQHRPQVMPVRQHGKSRMNEEFDAVHQEQELRHEEYFKTRPHLKKHEVSECPKQVTPGFTPWKIGRMNSRIIAHACSI